MTKLFKPDPVFARATWIMGTISFIALLLVILTSGTAIPSRVLISLPMLAGLCFALPVVDTFFTYVSINEKTLRAMALLRPVNISVSNIRSVNLPKSMLGYVTDIYIHYLDRVGEVRKIAIGTVNAYGDRSVSEMIRKLVALNPSITLDERAEKMMKRGH